MSKVKGYLKQIHPVLPVKNVSKAVDFYVNNLGDEPSYAGVSRDGIEIHLQWHDEKEWTTGIDRPMLRIYVDHIQQLFDEYKTKAIFHQNTSLKETPWRTKEFAFYDLYSNGLTFYRDL